MSGCSALEQANWMKFGEEYRTSSWLKVGVYSLHVTIASVQSPPKPAAPPLETANGFDGTTTITSIHADDLPTAALTSAINVPHPHLLEAMLLRKGCAMSSPSQQSRSVFPLRSYTS
jgi:hypothetical protein